MEVTYRENPDDPHSRTLREMFSVPADRAQERFAELLADARVQRVDTHKEGSEIQRGGRSYRLTAAGWRRLGSQGGLYELTESDRTFLGLREH